MRITKKMIQRHGWGPWQAAVNDMQKLLKEIDGLSGQYERTRRYARSRLSSLNRTRAALLDE
jgi:hypothetical protein